MSKIIYDVVRYLFSRYWPQSSKRPSGVSQNRKGRKITGRSGEAMEANNPNPGIHHEREIGPNIVVLYIRDHVVCGEGGRAVNLPK